MSFSIIISFVHLTNVAFIRFCVYNIHYNYSGGCYGLHISERSCKEI